MKVGFWIGCVIITLLSPQKLLAQNETIVSNIDIHVNVLNQINIKQTRNLRLVINADSISQIAIDPLHDIRAGNFEAVGSPSTSIKITFPAVLTLRQVGGNYLLKFHIKVSSSTKNEQNNSKLLKKNSISLKLSNRGEIYFWVGGKANIKDVPGGRYEGTLSFNLDYD